MKTFLDELAAQNSSNERVSAWAFDNSLEKLHGMSKVCDDLLKKIDKTKKFVHSVKDCVANID